MITVYDFMYLCCEEAQTFKIYDMAKNKDVWTGTINDLPASIEYCEVMSFDSVLYSNSKTITLNIDTAEE